MPPRKKSSTPAKKPTAKKTATKKPTTTPKVKEKTSKTPSTRQKTTAPGKPKPRKKPEPKLKRKKYRTKKYFPTFPYRLEYQDGKDIRVCHFQCEEHRDKHIKRYGLRKPIFQRQRYLKILSSHLLCFLSDICHIYVLLC